MSSMVNAWDNKRIDDKTAKKLLKEKVLEYTLPPHNLNRIQISQMINRSVTTVHRIQRDLVADGLLQTTENGYLIRSAPNKTLKTFQDLSTTDFPNIASVKKWKLRMDSNENVGAEESVSNFWKVCQTLDVHPDSFLVDFDEVLPLIEKFKMAFKEGKMKYIKKKHIDDPVKQSQANPQHYIEAVRSFIKGNGIEIPKGELVVKRKLNKIYAQIRLNDKERLDGMKFMNGISNDLRIIYIIHNEIGVRADTLFQMRPKFERFTRTFEGIQCEWYKAYIFESKQEGTPSGGVYEKYILTPNARLIASQLTPGKRIHSYTNIKKGKDEYNQKLRDFYASIGKISVDPFEQARYEKGTQEYYLVNEPTHAIRHSCVHWLMRITGNRTEEVSSLFWEQPQTLKIYAKQSFEDMLEDDTCALCNPDLNDDRYRRFCTLKHSLIYYNTKEEQRQELREKNHWGNNIET